MNAIHRMTYCFTGFLLLLALSLSAQADALSVYTKTSAEPLPAETAFVLTADPTDQDHIIFEWTIAPGTYLYQKAFSFHSEDARLGTPHMPPGNTVEDAFFGKTVIYRTGLTLDVPVLSMQQRLITVTVSYQGCHDMGFCYPPQTQTLTLDMPLPGMNPPQQNTPFSILQNQSVFFALLSFFGFGLLLAFTPCVLPMVPILSAIIIGEQQKHHRLHAFLLALTYVLAMAFTYASMGAIVAKLGSLVQAQLQSPFVLGITASILVFMAFWLAFDHRFTFFSRFNHPLHRLTQTLPRGEYYAAALMGVIASLVVSPCVTAPLVGALSYIALSGNILLGSSALFCLALGMGVPLIAFTWGGTVLLPKRGPWMQLIKYAFSIILLIMAFGLVDRFFVIEKSAQTTQQSSDILPFTHIHNSSELQHVLAAAKEAHHGVLLDFYADWCRSCVTLEKTVFTDPTVKAFLSQVTLLKVDVTDYNADLAQLQREWQVFGPPAILFFNPEGKEIPSLRVVGEVDKACFIEHLEAWKQGKSQANCSE